MNGRPKENVNPTLYATIDAAGRRRARDNAAIGTSAVAKYNFRCTHNYDDDDDDASESTHAFTTAPLGKGAWERSIHLALSSVASSESGDKNLSILRNAGFDIPAMASASGDAVRVVISPELKEPTFVPSPASPSPPVSSGPVTQGRPLMIPSSVSPQQIRDAIDAESVFEIIRNIQDPEHPNSLEELGVVKLGNVTVVDLKSDDAAVAQDTAGGKKGGGSGGGGGGGSGKTLSKVDVLFTPTIPHCSMATLIGLCLRVKLLRSLPSRFKVSVSIEPGTHASETAVNRQLDDKERVRAALENEHLCGVVDRCIGQGMGLA